MRHIAHAVLACICSSAPAFAQSSTDGTLTPPRSPRNANYTITARLDPAARTITGSEVIAWRNVTQNAATTLQFHLYWNAWKNPRSTFMREQALGGFGSDAVRRADEWARMDISSVAVGGVDRTASRRFVTPADDNANDETAKEVPLATRFPPAGPGRTTVAWPAAGHRRSARPGE